MSKLFLFVLLLPLPAAEASPGRYRVELQYFVEGKLSLSPRIIVNNGKKAEISDTVIDQKTGQTHGTFLVVTPTRVPGSPKGQIRLDMEIGKLDNGKKLEAWTPQILALEGEAAEMEVGNRDAAGNLVNAKRISVLVTEARD